MDEISLLYTSAVIQIGRVNEEKRGQGYGKGVLENH